MTATATATATAPFLSFVSCHAEKKKTHLECVLTAEALLAKGAREGLHGQMDALVPLEIVVAVE